jgi:hypothetical protein
VKINNIFWIVVDSVRSYSGTGDWRFRLKIMDELDDFYNFTNAYTAAPSTIMSAASMFTGNNTFKIARNYNDWELDYSEITPIAKILEEKNFEILPIDNSKRAREMLQDIIGRLDYKYFIKGLSHNSNWSNYTILEQFQNVLKKSNIKKKFIMTWFDCRGDILINNYVKQTIETIKKNNLYNDSLIILNSDHGYPDPKSMKFKSIKKYRHDLVVTEDNIKVPLLIKLPKDINLKRRNINKEVSLIDIYPTILELLGVTQKYKYDGNSLLGLMQKKKTNLNFIHNNDKFLRCDTRLFLQDGKITTLIKNRLKYVIYHDTGHEEIYNLKKDPNELQDLRNNKNYKSKFNIFKEYFLEQNKSFELLQKQKLTLNLKKSLINYRGYTRLFILCNLNNHYLDFIKKILEKLYNYKLNIKFFSTKKNNNTLASSINNFYNICDLNTTTDLLIVIDEKNYYRILDLTFFKAAKEVKLKKVFLDLNFNKNNLFFSKWVFPLLKYKKNFYFYKKEPQLIITDFIKIIKLSFDLYIKNLKIETPRMEDLKLDRDRILKSKLQINRKIDLYDFTFYLKNIGIWGGTQTQFWKLIKDISNKYKVKILFNNPKKYKEIRKIKINQKLNNNIHFTSFSEKSLKDQILKNLPKINLIKYFIIIFYKFGIFLIYIFNPILKNKFFKVFYKFLCTYSLIKKQFNTSQIFSSFLVENNIVNLLIFRLVKGKTGRLILNERNNILKQTNFILRATYRFALNSKIIIITNSLETFQYFKKYHHNTYFSYNYIFSKNINIKKKLKNTKINFLNVGRFVKQKNQLDLIHKFSMLTNKNLINLCIIGRGHLLFAIKNKIKDLQLEKIVHLGKPQKKLNKLFFHKYDVLIINSIYEGQSNVLMEAITNGLIIMMNDILKNETIQIYKQLSNSIIFFNNENFNSKINYILKNKNKIQEKLITKYSDNLKKLYRFNNLTQIHLKQF